MVILCLGLSVPQNQAELEQLRTQEVLKGIVQRTADNLIDISSIRMLDRIQPEHAVERAAEYRSILAGVGPQLRQFIPSDTTNTLSNSPPDPNSRFSDLLAGGDISKEDPECEEMAEVIQRVQATLKEIKIDPVGDIVVPFMST
ncbi:hypothetical protein DFJ77DRAFT_472435 [Powellomyces hirtus]|nr:hypothetical protein DFJ77DRAFT_472435 [Powellomyces hirtus]